MRQGFAWRRVLGHLAALAGLIPCAYGASANTVFDANFVHETHSGTISGDSSEIHHPFTNGMPAGMLFVTPNQNAGGTSILDFYNLGVRYDGSGSARWSIFHQNAAAMVSGAWFNVLVPHPDADAFVHVADAANITGDFTVIDHASINGDPDARVIVTQNWNPPGSAGVSNDHAIGVFYLQSAAKWAVFNEDGAAMPLGAAFNVLVLESARFSHLHTADSHNTTGNRTFIEHASLNGNPDALLQVTQNWNPGLTPGTYNDHPVGVFYDSLQQRWAITNLDGVSIPLGAAFNVLIPPEQEASWLHGANSGNIGFSGTTYMSHPLIDGELSPILFTTARLDVVGGTGYPLDPTAVAYDALVGQWYLRNQWGPSWPANTYTNVYHPPINLRAFVHQAGVNNLQYTVFRHPLTDFDPNAIIFVQPHMNPADGPLVIIPDRVGVVWFNFGSGTVWAVQNEPNTFAIANDASYNIYVPPPEAGAFKHTVLISDTYFTVLDDPALNGDPLAGVLVTHNIADSNAYLDKTVGVRYDQSLARWTIATLDGSPLGTGQVFNVLPLPEPGGTPAFVAGVALLGLLRRRLRRRRAPRA